MTRIEKHAERHVMTRFFGSTPEESLRRMDRATVAIRMRKERTRTYARRLGIA